MFGLGKAERICLMCYVVSAVVEKNLLYLAHRKITRDPSNTYNAHLRTYLGANTIISFVPIFKSSQKEMGGKLPIRDPWEGIKLVK